MALDKTGRSKEHDLKRAVLVFFIYAIYYTNSITNNNQIITANQPFGSCDRFSLTLTVWLVLEESYCLYCQESVFNSMMSCSNKRIVEFQYKYKLSFFINQSFQPNLGCFNTINVDKNY